MALPRHLVVHLLSLAFAVAIAFALIEPVPPNLENATHDIAFPVDKLVHFGLFLVAAVPWRRSLALLGVSLCPFLFNLTGPIYLVGALVLGLAFVWFAIQFSRQRTDARARQLFYASLLYLPLLLVVMVLDKVK